GGSDEFEHSRVGEDPRDEPDEHARHDKQQSDRARVVTNLGEYATSCREGAAQAHDALLSVSEPPSAVRMSLRKASSASRVPVSASSPVGVSSAMTSPS